MKQVIECFHELSESIQKNYKDMSLIANLQKCLLSLETNSINVQVFSRLMLSVYDLSNHNTLIQTPNLRNSNVSMGFSNITNSSTLPSIQIHPLSLKLKLISMRMICILMQMMMKDKTNFQRLDRQIEVEALEIMVISIRICLDSDADYELGEIVQFEQFCNQLYQYSCGSYGLESDKSGILGQQFVLIYLLNKFDMMRLNLNESTFSINEIHKNLQEYKKMLVKFQSIPQRVLQKYKQYIQNVTTQITLKLIRSGSVQCLQKLKEFLPKSFLISMNKIMEGNKDGDIKIGEVYELYWHICNNGIQSVSIQALEKFIGKDNIFQGEEIFQAILLINQPLMLEIWFNQANKRMTKPPNIISGYQCFIQLIVGSINKEKNNNKHQRKEPASGPSFRQQNEQNLTQSLVRLCKQVMLTLIRQNRDSSIPIAAVVLYILKFMIDLVIKMYNFQIWMELADNLYLLCSKHSSSLSEFQKHLTVLELYFSLLVFNDTKNKLQISKDENQRHIKENTNKNKSKSNNTRDTQRLKESYNRFLKHNSNQRGQYIKLLKTCFQISNCNTNQNQKQMIINLKKKPEYFILFCEQKQKAMLLLEMNHQDMMEIQNVFNIYLSLFQLKCWDEVEMDKICLHLEKFILSTEFSKLSMTPEICVKVKNYLGKQIQRQNPLYCYLFLYFACLSSQFTKIRSQNYGISFNKYSKLLKILDMVQFDSQVVCILKIIVCKCCQRYKKQIVNDGRCIPEAGQIAFIKIIYNKAEEWINRSSSNFGISQNFKNSFQFVKYSYFQILCMNGRGEELEQIIDQESDLQLQQLYINSEFIPKKLKLLLLRKMFKNNLMSANSTISLNDMKQLILLAESLDESFIYVSSTIKMFGEKGKRFISILAQQNERVGELCLRIFNSEHL